MRPISRHTAAVRLPRPGATVRTARLRSTAVGVGVCVALLWPSLAMALDLRLALGEGVRGDADRLRARAHTAIDRCADGRDVEVWLTLERASGGHRAVTRLLQRGVTLGQRSVRGRKLGPLVDAAALLVCLALERMPPAPPPRPPRERNGRAPRRQAEAAPAPPVALPESPTASAAPPSPPAAQTVDVDAWQAARLALAVQRGDWAPATSAELRAGLVYGRGPLHAGADVVLWWLPPGEDGGAIGAAVRLSAGAAWRGRAGSVGLELGAIAGASLHDFAESARQSAPWLAGDVVLRVLPAFARIGALTLGVEVGATPRLWPLEVRRGGQLQASGEPALWRAGLCIRIDGSAPERAIHTQRGPSRAATPSREVR